MELDASDRRQVLYLYGVIPVTQALPSGVGIPLAAVSHATLTAVVEAVSATDFSPETLDQKLQSIEWVAGLARKHEAVLDEAMREGSVIPARLCTLFSDGEALKRSLATNKEWFVDTLKRLGGRKEWGLKAFCDERRLEQAVAADNPEIRGDDDALLDASPGRAFVLRKQRDARLAELSASHLSTLVEEIVDALCGVSDDVRVRPLLQTQATGRREPMVLNAAALVSTMAEGAFHDAIAEIKSRYESEGIAFELSGPWPAYSFCDDNNDAAADAPEALEGRG